MKRPTNKEMHKIAVNKVIEYEKRKRSGSKPKELHEGEVYDIETESRFIEVKSQWKDGLPSFVVISQTEKFWEVMPKKARKYYIYSLFNLKDKAKLMIIPPELIFSETMRTGKTDAGAILSSFRRAFLNEVSIESEIRLIIRPNKLYTDSKEDYNLKIVNL
ncbi:MAG: DUF3883 domain-containing protein [Candidatus Altiarchaeota archaeon]|nr:DUF3883 domain-containing protein [Candidatus Altiarchaeota archaeon]